MAVDPVAFNQLVIDVAALTTRVEALEDSIDVSVAGSLAERITSLESTTVSVAQVTAMKKTLAADITANTTAVAQLIAAIALTNTSIQTLNRWRVDLRHELMYEQATGDGAKTTWTLAEAYDETSSFIVFQSNLTLVDPSLITFSSPLTGEFTTSVSLTDDVHVIYMVSLET